MGNLGLVIGGGFDTTTALTAHSMEWLSQHPDERERLSRERDTLLDSATEEFLRYYTPAPGDGRTFSDDVELEGTQFKEGERLWISWAMANRDPSVFHDPNKIVMDRKGNRHFSFGLGVHRCIGSNVARTVFKSMLTAVLDRMPDYVCDPDGTVHYETIGVIQGMRHLPATFTPGKRTRRRTGRDAGEAPADLRRAATGPADHRTQGSRGHRLSWSALAHTAKLFGHPAYIRATRREGQDMRSLTLSIPLMAAAVALAPVAHAQMPYGNYEVQSPRDPGHSWLWEIRPCEPGHPRRLPAGRRPSPGPTAKRRRGTPLAHLANGTYTMTVDVPDGVRCTVYFLPSHDVVHVGCGDAYGLGDFHL